MGLSSYPCASDGVLPFILMNTVMSVALFKSLFRTVLRAIGGGGGATAITAAASSTGAATCAAGSSGRRRVSVTNYNSLCHVEGGGEIRSVMVECCVCLSGFQGSEEVSELPCKHFFHTACLDKWFDNRNHTCPLCRS